MKVSCSLNEGFKRFLVDIYGTDQSVRKILLAGGLRNEQVNYVAKRAYKFERMIIRIILDEIRLIGDVGDYRARIISYIYCFQDNDRWSPSKEAGERGFKEDGVRWLHRTTIEMFRERVPLSKMRSIMVASAKVILKDSASV